MIYRLLAAWLAVLISLGPAASLAQPPEVTPPPTQPARPTIAERLQRKLNEAQQRLQRVANQQAHLQEERNKLEQRIAALQTALQTLEANPAIGGALEDVIGGPK
jgi:septal ring factor EnvC (AmiA/AmiB activator)